VVSDVHIRANRRNAQNSLRPAGHSASRCHHLCKAKPISGGAGSLQMVLRAVVTQQQAVWPGAEAKPIKANLGGRAGRHLRSQISDRKWEIRGNERGRCTHSRQTNPIPFVFGLIMGLRRRNKPNRTQFPGLQRGARPVTETSRCGVWSKKGNVKQTQYHSQALGGLTRGGRMGPTVDRPAGVVYIRGQSRLVAEWNDGPVTKAWLVKRPAKGRRWTSCSM
jgi:hypothetical protein